MPLKKITVNVSLEYDTDMCEPHHVARDVKSALLANMGMLPAIATIGVVSTDAKSDRPLPNGFCWCGCGGAVNLGSYFMQGHDRAAVFRTIRELYGDTVGFLIAHGVEQPTIPGVVAS